MNHIGGTVRMTRTHETFLVQGDQGRGDEMPTALVIEDDAAVGGLLCDLLAAEGAAVLRAGGMRDGLALARTGKPDVILLDHHLPDGTGASLLATLRRDEATHAIPVIVLSGAPQALATMAPPPDGLVAKPFDLDDLLSEVGKFVPLGAGAG